MLGSFRMHSMLSRTSKLSVTMTTMSVMSVALVTMFLTVAASVTAFVVHQSDTTILNALNVRSRIRIKQRQQVVEKTTKWTKNNLNNSFSSSTSTSTTLLSSSVENNGNDNENENESNKTEDNEILISSLQNTLCSIEALEERNTAQMQSFIDEKDQWESLELYEQELLSSKEEILKRLSELN